MRRTLLTVVVALLAAGCVTVRPDSGGRPAGHAAAADARSPAAAAPRAPGPRPPRGVAWLVHTGPAPRQWPVRPSPAGLHAASQTSRPVPAQRGSAPTPRRLGFAPGRRPPQGRHGRRTGTARTPRPFPRSAPGYGAATRPATAQGFPIPSHPDAGPFALCGLAEGIGLGQTVADVCRDPFGS
ncbi:hypothetical protein ABZ876_23765 [Streptomyces sp. NPDC046931]|uniref:hypothetical protein n=1 Tax=Streptomyces sp. NPDC046931 TaxID=3154806 RepID=UPI0033D605D9